ncbi:hypothetical protein ACFSSE_17890 [Pedobacter alpinus]|uniref:Bacteriocin class II with double-glycine leader peptide n=2 Tax=Pedobacter alpinus TaxID=1590643 RepID=A0ABW5TWC2_9SPHI
MEKLENEQMEKIFVGKGQCGKAVALGALFGGLFGGIGSVAGGLIAATGPECLAWWDI